MSAVSASVTTVTMATVANATKRASTPRRITMPVACERRYTFFIHHYCYLTPHCCLTVYERLLYRMFDNYSARICLCFWNNVPFDERTKIYCRQHGAYNTTHINKETVKQSVDISRKFEI